MQKRRFLKLAGSASILAIPGIPRIGHTTRPVTTKRLKGTDLAIPAIGMGTWLTFDLSPDSTQIQSRIAVLNTFFKYGGKLVDSSPMYGYSEETVGHCLRNIDNADPLFSASKIWTPAGFLGAQQMNNTERLWGVKPIDLMQIHNLVAWQKHLPQLREWKQQGRIRHLGVTTSHGRRHEELEKLLLSEQFDFVQFTYNIADARTEKRLLPIAQDLGINVIVNRPFRRGRLFEQHQHKPLPAIAAELGCKNWAQYFLLYTISHPAITCAIPATRRADHMIENMQTLQLELPDMKTRAVMRDAIAA